ncbi:hypothetical protein D3C78_1759870 [compost metagenome]
MGEQGQAAAEDQQALVRRDALAKAKALVASGARVEECSQEAGQQRVHKSL